VLREPAGEEDVDDVPGLWLASGRFSSGEGSQESEVIHPKSHQSNRTGLQHGTAGGIEMR
jgi:hypothetical protein